MFAQFTGSLTSLLQPMCDRDRPSHKMSACGEWRSDDTHTGKLTVGWLRLLNVDVYLFATL